MPQGPGTYGSKRGRPPVKKKSPIKNMAYWKAKSNSTPNKFMGTSAASIVDKQKGVDPNESLEEKIDRKTDEKVDEKIDQVVNQKSGDGLNI